MSALVPIAVLLFLGLMGWVLLRLIGGPGGPETFNPNSCSSCSSKQGGKEEPEPQVGKQGSENLAGIPRYPVASAHYRLPSPLKPG